jgi:hypothetical protein
MTCPPLWRKWHGHPSLPKPYPLVLGADGKYSLQRNNFCGVAHQQQGEWFWRGLVVVFGEFHHYAWPDLEVAAWALHTHCNDINSAGVVAQMAAGGRTWIPDMWFGGHLPRSIKQKTGRPSVAGSWRLGLEGNILSVCLAPGPGPHRHSPWQVYWNGKRVVANKGFEWFSLDEAQDAAEAFDAGNAMAYRLR